jgi:hypothetical protein
VIIGTLICTIYLFISFSFVGTQSGNNRPIRNFGGIFGATQTFTSFSRKVEIHNCKLFNSSFNFQKGEYLISTLSIFSVDPHIFYCLNYKFNLDYKRNYIQNM